MAAGEGQPRYEIASRHAREELVRLPGKAISVIGTNHGYLDSPFPGREHVGEEIRKEFGIADVLVLDSLSGLEDQSQLDLFYNEDIMFALEPLPPHKYDFFNWGIHYAIENNAMIVGADVIASVPALFPIFKQEAEEIDVFSEHATSGEGLQEVLNALLLIGLGEIVTRRIEEKEGERPLFERKVDRRKALALGISALGALSVSQCLKAEELTPPSREEREKIVSRFAEPSVLTETDYSDETMVKVARWNAAKAPLLTTLRNALVADSLRLPNDELLPPLETDEVKIAVAMGYDHLAIPEESRISYLLTHDVQRREIIFLLLGSLIEGIESGEFNDIGVPPIVVRRVMDQLMSTKSYTFDYTTEKKLSYKAIPHAFAAPTVAEWIARRRVWVGNSN